MRKKILVLDTGKEWGGGTNSLLELLRRIDRDKYRFTALFYINYTKGNTSDIKSEIEKLGIEFLLLEQRKRPVIAKILREAIRLIFFFSKKIRKYFIFFVDYQFRIKPNAEKIAEILRTLKIDMLYMNNQPSSNLEGIVASKITSLSALQHSRIETSLNSFEVRTVNLCLKKMICVSHGVKSTFVSQGIDDGKCVVVHNGIDTATKPAISFHEIRRKFGVFEKDILIGTVGSLLKRKRIRDLIDIFSTIIGRAGYPIKCIIVGEGPEKGDLLAQVKRKNLEDKVIFAGFQPDAISHINALDIFCLTSEKEGLPRVILEAMLLEKPVVASNITGPSELVVDGETGFLVPVGQPDKFADKILQLIEYPELRRQMGQKARKRIIEDFSIEKYITGAENVFAEVLGN